MIGALVIAGTFALTSPAFKEGANIPSKFTCDAGQQNPSPALAWSDAAAAAKSLALIMHDPDAPMPGGFTHWVVWNIDPATTNIKDESTPPGAVEGMNGAS